MIILPGRAVFILIPKTGALSLKKWALARPGATEFAPHMAGAPGHFSGRWSHHRIVPNEHGSLPRVAVIRHPKQRAASLWDYCVLRHGPAFGFDPHLWTLAEFCRWLPEWQDAPYPRAEDSDWHRAHQEFFAPQSHLLHRVRVEHLLTFESVPTSLASLPFVEPAEIIGYPHLNRGCGSRGRHWTAAAAAAVEDWAAGDYDLMERAARSAPHLPDGGS